MDPPSWRLSIKDRSPLFCRRLQQQMATKTTTTMQTRRRTTPPAAAAGMITVKRGSSEEVGITAVPGAGDVTGETRQKKFPLISLFLASVHTRRNSYSLLALPSTVHSQHHDRIGRGRLLEKSRECAIVKSGSPCRLSLNTEDHSVTWKRGMRRGRIKREKREK